MAKFQTGDKVKFVVKDGIHIGIVQSSRRVITVNNDSFLLYDILCPEENTLHKGVREAKIDAVQE